MSIFSPEAGGITFLIRFNTEIYIYDHYLIYGNGNEN